MQKSFLNTTQSYTILDEYLRLPCTSRHDIAIRIYPESALLEWESGLSSQDPLCLHRGEITNLEA
jgi:hypothetical protein